MTEVNKDWGITFTKINVAENNFETLLALGLGNENKTKEVFNRIKSEFSENKGEPELMIDLRDNHFDIHDDYSITLAQAETIANLLGHNLEKGDETNE